ncbi:MAG: hypothetical protein AAF616_16145 [Bacteroidota bacterium]
MKLGSDAGLCGFIDWDDVPRSYNLSPLISFADARQACTLSALASRILFHSASLRARLADDVLSDMVNRPSEPPHPWAVCQ